jgi:putative thioredoxin
MTVIDVTDATFKDEVLERSATTPVVVDFWAQWCAPCRALTPALEKAAAAREGGVVLAKVDTDANPLVAHSFRIQSIPAVKAFKDRRVVAEFVGAQPPAAVERFFDALLPSEADHLVAAGDEASLRRALELEPGRADAAVALARLLLARGDAQEALEVAQNAAGSFQAQALAARIRLQQSGALDLDEAWRAIDAGDRERAVDVLLDAISAAGDSKDDLRQLIVGILDELGVEHPVAREGRRRLAAALY